MLITLLEKIGRSVIGSLEGCGRIVLLFVETIFQFRHRPNLRHVVHQMAHLGADSLPIIALTLLFTGMVFTLQTAQEFIKYGAQSSVGGIMAISMGRELAPVLTGLVAAGRVGAAITAEIGSMKVTEQIDALRVMATNPVAYLVVPRLVACVIMLPILVCFGDVIGMAGGFIVAKTYAGISFYTFMHSIKVFAVINDLTGGLLKSMVFGAIVALIGCYKGLNTAEGAEGVGRATTSSVVTSMILIFISNYFLSVILYR